MGTSTAPAEPDEDELSGAESVPVDNSFSTAVDGFGAGHDGAQALSHVTQIPAEAVPVLDQIRGYLAWPDSLEDFRRQVQAVVADRNTHLVISASEPTITPGLTRLIELDIESGAALGMPDRKDHRDNRLWLRADRLNQATVRNVYWDLETGGEPVWELVWALGLQVRRLDNLGGTPPLVFPRMARRSAAK